MVTTVESIHCLKCKVKKDVTNAEEITMKNGRPALRGTCPTCGGKVQKIVSKKKD